jgi:WhiB family transcriptional regulator, redox-sensing transcriptional regulator
MLRFDDQLCPEGVAMTVVMERAEATDFQIGACTRDPDRWLTATDDATKAVCRACPRRWLCAKEACEMPAAQGMWAGVHIPEAGRGRSFALKQLRSLAEHGGHPVRR